MITIYRNGNTHLQLVLRGQRTITSATQVKQILSDDSVQISVASNSVLDIRINDTFSVFGETYRINQPPTVRKISESEYEYTIVGQGVMFDMLRCKFFNADGTGFKTTFEFPIIGDLQLFLTVVANNMKRFSPLWEVGTFPANTETKTITFSSDTCISALQKICQEFKTEFWVKTEGGKFKIHTGQFGSTLPIPFQYGKGNGLYSISRNNVDETGIINRLYVEGGTENLPAGYRSFSDKLKFSDAGYIEDAALIADMGLKEGSIEFPEVYPHRTGIVSSVTSLTSFVDTSMDFDLNEKESDGITTKYLVPGQTAKLHVNKGNLAGYQFEITKYDHATKTFTIIPFKNEQGQEFPDANTEAFQFAAGDEYVLLDIYMPETYVTNAETELQTKAQEQFNLLKQAKVNYDIEIASDYLPKLSKLPEIGDLLQIIDAPLGINKVLRINAITREFISNGEVDNFRYKISIADAYEISFSSKLILDVKEIKTTVNQIKLGQISLSKLGFKATQELKDLLFDPDGYFDTGLIKPGSIETGMLAVGYQSQQLTTDLVMRTNIGGANVVSGDASRLYSQTLDKEWTLAAFDFTIPDNEARYVYAVLSKTGTTGTIVFSTNKINYDSNPSDYYIVIGIVTSVIEGVRIFVPTYGTTTINGGLIRTGIISSQDGQTTFNLNTGEITGNIKFTSNSAGLAQLSGGGENLILEDGTVHDFTNNRERYIDKELDYTFSCDVNNSFNLPEATIYLVGKQNYQYAVIAEKPIQLFTGTTRVSITAKLTINQYQRIFGAVVGAGSEQFEISKPKLETGMVATDYTVPQQKLKDDLEAALQRIVEVEQNASFDLTQITNNIITSGTLILGNSDGANAGITGVGDYSGVWAWGGSSFADMLAGNAKLELRRNGAIISRNPQGTWEASSGLQTWRDNAGNIRRQFGWVDGAPVDRRYSADGALLYEDTVYGPKIYAIAESWTPARFYRSSVTDINASDQTLIDDITPVIAKTINKKVYKNGDGTSTIFFEGTLSVVKNYDAFKYNPGNAGANNAQYAGYKTTDGQKTSDYNIPNGWYIQRLGIFAYETSDGPIDYISDKIDVVFILDGNIKTSRFITITK